MNASKLAGQHLSGVYDPAVESDGLTLDTDRGPVDLVAIRDAAAGRPVALTPAERYYLVTRTRRAAELRAVAATLGQVERRRAVAA